MPRKGFKKGKWMVVERMLYDPKDWPAHPHVPRFPCGSAATSTFDCKKPKEKGETK
jgi:hypothetical protein